MESIKCSPEEYIIIYFLVLFNSFPSGHTITHVELGEDAVSLQSHVE